MSLGVEVTSSCLCVGQAFSQGRELWCHTNPLSGWAYRARAGAAGLWGCTCKGRRGWGAGEFGGGQMPAEVGEKMGEGEAEESEPGGCGAGM